MAIRKLLGKPNYKLHFDKFIKNICSTSESMTKILHVPVMASQCLKYLKPQPEQIFIDMTFGAGGISKLILDESPDTLIVALDRDPLAHSLSLKLSEKYPGRLLPLLGRFSELPKLLKSHNISSNSVDGILFDLGCSSMQMDQADRGFSISKDGPLDMRMDEKRFPHQPTAADILAHIDEPDLFKMLRVYGEEKHAKKITRAIMEARYTFRKIIRTHELKELVASACNDQMRLDKLQRQSHPATKTFQALRIFVNNELNELNYGMILAHRYLKIGGKIITLTFHSLEDRIVKRHLVGNIIENSINPLPLKYSNHSLLYEKSFVDSVLSSKWKLLNKHVIIPDADEIEKNPRSRSAKFRAAIKVK